MEFKIIKGKIYSDYWANTRIKALSRYFKKKRFSKKTKVLDLGCGEGYLGEIFEKKGAYVLYADYDREKIRNLKKKNKMVLDATKLSSKFKSSFFDIIICADVLEHIKNDTAVLKGIFKTLKEGGRAIIIFPAHKLLYSKNQIKIGHYRRYNLEETRKMIEKIGFKIEYKRFLCSFLLVPLFMMQRFADEIKFYKKKEEKARKEVVERIKKPLNIICELDNLMKLPFGLSLLFIIRKKNIGF